jgi:pyruvate/2-oxoglutarate/acetoin dehydrogenase E1 component
MESRFTSIPGMKMACPSNAYDAKGMIKIKDSVIKTTKY